MSLSLLLFRLHTNTVESHSQNTPGLHKLIGKTLNILRIIVVKTIFEWVDCLFNIFEDERIT